MLLDADIDDYFGYLSCKMDTIDTIEEEPN